MEPGTSKPFSQRTIEVLGTSYSDHRVGDALEVLDEYHRHGGGMDELDTLQDLLDVDGEYLDTFVPVIEAIEKASNKVAQSRRNFEEILSKSKEIEQVLQPLLLVSSGMHEEQIDVEEKLRLLDALRAKFVLSEADALILTSASNDVDSAFYSALARAQQIYRECEMLLPSEHQTAGVAIMEQMSKYIEAGFDKLSRWTQRVAKTLLRSPGVNTERQQELRHAIRVLWQRPAFLRRCLETVSEERQGQNLRYFTKSLQEFDVQHGRPLDLSAADPVRYTGDLLAWLHQTIAQDREFVEELTDDRDVRHDPTIGQAAEILRADAQSVRDMTVSLVDADLKMVMRPLRNRIEASTSRVKDLRTLFKIRNLVLFYVEMFKKYFDEGSFVISQLRRLDDYLRDQFMLAEKLLLPEARQVDRDPAISELQPPQFLIDTVSILDDLLALNEKSMAVGPETNAIREVVFHLVDGIVGLCEHVCGDKPEPQRSIFLLNCIEYIKSRIETYREAAEKASLLSQFQAHIYENAETAQFDWYLQTSGFGDIIRKVEGSEEYELSAAEVQAAAERLENFVISSATDSLDRLAGLNNRRAATAISDAAARKFCDAYQRAEIVILEKVQYGQTILSRSSRDLRILLGVS